ncbi:CmcI family methyltransferase [Glutamicibacter sp.]|jgi:Cephalosporin hydroxylase|uniref:CmcI family methyltransferase n=1 Tax=Glutamicibacter sp. TaxID=1931995 RepID=UPI002FDB8746
MTQEIIDAFHIAYYNSRVWERTFYNGVRIAKNPMDLMVLNEILWECQPDLVIETGTHFGGSALYMADVMDKIGHGYVCTIDIVDEPGLPKHDRIHYIRCASSVDELVVNEVHLRAQKPRVMVVLDSNHSYTHVKRELECYAPMVTKGQYLVVEDTNVNGHPVLPEHGPGPWEAVREWWNIRGPSYGFEVDDNRDKKFGFSFNPFGYYRRK